VRRHLLIMIQRSSHNWQTRSGVFDALNTRFLTFTEDYPVLSSIFNIDDFEVTMCNNYKKIGQNSLVSSFLDDYILERYWNDPIRYLSVFKGAKYVLSPDFSLLIGMPIPMQQWNVYRNRLVGYVWQSEGIKVIPTVSWSDYKSFDFCFNGIDKGSVVAISNTGCRNDEQKKYFDDGFNELIKKIQPSKIIFQCNKKYRHFYNEENIIIIESFWDNKRKQLKTK
jgi:hypothetical protein